MEDCRANTYLCVKRFRGEGVSGNVNIPYGTILHREEDYLIYNGKPLFVWRCQNSVEHFVSNDDGQGEARWNYIQAIYRQLSVKPHESKKQGEARQARWNKVWEDPICAQYRDMRHEDFWIWSEKLNHAAICDLSHIMHLVGGRLK